MSLPQHLQLSSSTTITMISSSSTNPYLIDQLHFMQNQERQSFYQASDYLAAPPPLCNNENTTPNKITSADRRTMCSWSYQIVDACSIDREIALIAMTYCDRFMSTTLSNKRANTALNSRREFQLGFITCLIIALKSRGGLQVDSDFVSDVICRGMYGPHEIVEMEREILSALEWRLNGPSPHEFIGGFLELLPQSSVVSKNADLIKLLKALAYAHVEKAMLDYDTAINATPSLIAFAAIMAAISNIDSSIFSPLDRLAWMQHISEIMDSKDRVDSSFVGSSIKAELLECNSNHSEEENKRYCSPVSPGSSFTSSMASLSVESESDSAQIIYGWDTVSIEQ